MSGRLLRITGICFWLLALYGCDRGPDTATDAAGALASGEAASEHWRYPRERAVDGRRVVVHAPQIRSWEDFEHFTAQVAVQFLEDDTAARDGVIELSGDTAVDLDTGLVSVAKPRVDRVVFTGMPGAAQENGIRNAVERQPLEIPVDVFLFHLADDVLETPPPPGFNTDPPLIDVVETPALSCSSKTRRHWGRGRPYSSRRCFFAFCPGGRVGAAE